MGRLGRILGALSTGHWLLTVAAPIIAVVVGGTRKLSWPWLVALAVAVFLGVLGGLLAYYDLTSPRPKVRWAGTASVILPREDYLIHPDGTKQPLIRQFAMTALQLGIANDPPFRRRTSRLDNASLWFSFFPLVDDTTEPLFETAGAWGFHPHEVVSEASLPPNNQHRVFAVAFKHDGEKDWYAASPDLWRHADLRIPSYKLPERFIVRVTLRGTGLIADEGWWFEVGPPREAGGLEIRSWASAS